MNRNKIFSLAYQVLSITGVCYFVLFDAGFIYRTHWLPSFIFAMAFFHVGTFISLYVTIMSKELSKEKEELIYNFSFFVFCGFITLLLYHNCQIVTNQFIINYLFGLFLSVYSIIFLFKIYYSYLIYKSTQIINPKN